MTKYYCWLILLLFFINALKADTGSIIKSKQNNPTLQTVDCPTLNDDNVSIVPSTCNSSDGKILGLAGNGTGTLQFTWYNDKNVIVGTTADLTGVPAGVYKVSLRDDSKCPAVVREGYVVPIKDQVVIDNTKTVIKSPDCNQANGSITNINIKNAAAYQWFDENKKPIANTANLTGIAAGLFKLVATNKDGCSVQSTYKVTGGGSYPTILQIDTAKVVCGMDNQIKITFDMKDTDPFYNYFLYDDDGKVAQQGIIVYSPDQPTSITLKMKPDTRYKLVAADPNNCLTTLGTYSLGFPVFAIDTSIAFVRNDACGQKTGAVVGLHVIGADDPRYMKYTWTDETGKIVGQFLQLTSVGAGTYTLNVLAVNGGCTDSKTFTITDDVINALAPSIDNLKMCLPGVALLSVTDVDGTGGYNLYDSNNNLIISNQFGKFAVDVKETTDYYVAHTVGTCESPKTKVTVTVDLPNVEIPNTFTPNNDGVNDFWNIKGLEQFPNVTVDIYTRYGQLVYHSAGYARPFDGTTAKQKILPVGAYYYVIDVHKPVCLGKIAGNITIIR